MYHTVPGTSLLLGEDKYYLSLAYYHFYPILMSYTCSAKFFKKFLKKHLKEI